MKVTVRRKVVWSRTVPGSGSYYTDVLIDHDEDLVAFRFPGRLTRKRAISKAHDRLLVERCLAPEFLFALKQL